MEEFHVHLLPTGEVGFFGCSVHGDLQVYDLHPSLRDDARFQGKWDARYVLERTSNGNPVIYAAVNSHALYGCAGAQIRFAGFGNDNTSRGRYVDFDLTDITSASCADVWANQGNCGSVGVASYNRRFDPITNQPDLFKQAIRHFHLVPNWVMWALMIFWFLVPTGVYFIAAACGTPQGLALMASALSFVGQFYFLKLLLGVVGGPAGISPDREHWYNYILPYKFY